MDGARILPFLGGFAFLVPTLWAAEAGTAAGMFYLFFVWIVLIGLAWLVARRLMSGGTLPTEEGD